LAICHYEERERVTKDTRRVGAKVKYGEEVSDISWEEKEQIFVRRFPGNAHSSF
jgi:hypothetical protein